MRVNLRSAARKPLARTVARTIAAAALLLATACSGATAQGPTVSTTPARAAHGSADEPSSATNAAIAERVGYHVRRCSDAIAVLPDSGSSTAGFRDIDSAEEIGSDELTPDGAGKLPIHKFVLQVPRAAAGLIAISIAPRDRDVAGLSYDPSQWATGTLAIRDAAHTVVVETCADGDAQYNGGFVVDGGRCVHVRVKDVTGAGAVERLNLPFGVARCA